MFYQSGFDCFCDFTDCQSVTHFSKGDGASYPFKWQRYNIFLEYTNRMRQDTGGTNYFHKNLCILWKKRTFAR